MPNNGKYDLEERCIAFSGAIINLLNTLRRNTINDVLIKQLVRSSTSIGANYLEANDALGTKDFIMRLRISRKEAKETIYWLKILSVQNRESLMQINDLLKEAVEIKNIISAIINKVKLKTR